MAITSAMLIDSVRSQQHRKCTLALDELDSLVELLDDIERQPTDDSSELTESSEEGTMDETPVANRQCTRELQRLQNSIRHLQVSYLALKQNTVLIDVDKYEAMKKTYAWRKKDLATKLEQLLKQANSQHRTQLNELKRKIQAVEKQLTEALAGLEQQRQQNVAYYIQLVANDIRAGRTEQALDSFQHLMTYNSDPYRVIVKKVYDSGNRRTAASATMEFLRMVDFQHQPVAGYEALVDAMIEANALNGPEAVELMKDIQSLIIARDGKQQIRSVALMKKFRSHAS